MKFDIRKLREEKSGLVNLAEGFLKMANDSETSEERATGKKDYESVMADIVGVNEKIDMTERFLDIERTTPAKISADDYQKSISDATPTIEGGHDRAEDKPFTDIGDFCKSVHGERAGNVDIRLSPKATASGQGESLDSDGGYLIPAPMAGSILERTYNIGEILKRVNMTPISNGNGITLKAIDETSRVDGSRMGGVQGYWLDEAGDFTPSKLKFRKMDLKVHKLGAMMFATEELLMDASAITARINKEVPDELRFKVEDAILFGDGAAKPKGILNSQTGNAVITVAKESGQTADTIVHKNIRNMWERMPARNRANAVWLCNQDVESQLADMTFTIGTAGVVSPLYKEPMTGNGFGTIKGRPVIPVEYCATLGDAGDVVLVDLSEYQMITKGGIKTAQSMHVRFVNEEQAFRFSWRVDGQPVWNKALTPYKGTVKQSPYIQLAARA